MLQPRRSSSLPATVDDFRFNKRMPSRAVAVRDDLSAAFGEVIAAIVDAARMARFKAITGLCGFTSVFCGRFGPC
jgi:hypothetical protein